MWCDSSFLFGHLDYYHALAFVEIAIYRNHKNDTHVLKLPSASFVLIRVVSIMIKMKRFWQGSSYASVPTANEAMDLESTKEKTPPAKKTKPILRHIQWFAALGLTMIVFSLVIFLRGPQPKAPVLETCRNSSIEALSLNYNLGIISFAWLPARCFDQELMNQFLALRD